MKAEWNVNNARRCRVLHRSDVVTARRECWSAEEQVILHFAVALEDRSKRHTIRTDRQRIF